MEKLKRIISIKMNGKRRSRGLAEIILIGFIVIYILIKIFKG